MAVIKTLAVSAHDTWSTVFQLAGDDTIPRTELPRRALINATRSDSTVTLRRYADVAGTTLLSEIDMGSTMEAVEVPVTGYYKVGVATGNYGGTALTITVEQ